MANAMSERARQLRKVKGPAERMLWRHLRELNRQGFHFRQQVPIGHFIADFAEHEHRLILELDGSHHGLPDQQDADLVRTRWLQSQGYRVIRFWNGEVAKNIDGVMTQILEAIGVLTEPASPSSTSGRPDESKHSAKSDHSSPPPLAPTHKGEGDSIPLHLPPCGGGREGGGHDAISNHVSPPPLTPPHKGEGDSISLLLPPCGGGREGGEKRGEAGVLGTPTPSPSPQGGGGSDLTSPPPLWGRPGRGSHIRQTRGFGHVDTWIFDLDNTLYPASCNLFAQVDHRMGEFIAKTIGVPYAHARHLQKAYYRQFGTTLAGLMQVHKLKPEPFLEYVHDIDLTVLPELPELAAEIEKLPGRRLIFTNGSRRHAENVAAKIGVLHLFEDICDIAALEFIPKPERSAFERMAKLHDIRATTSAMFEDMPHNLEVPHDLGMATVLVHSDYVDHPVQVKMRSWTALPEHIHHMTQDLTGFLTGMVNGARIQDGG